MEIVPLESIFFGPTRFVGPTTETVSVGFPRQVVSAVAAIRGYQATTFTTDKPFFEDPDMHFGQLDLGVSTSFSGSVVTVQARLGLRDWSGEWDNDYNGRIDVVVFAELEPEDAPPRRTDLTITGAEVTQAIQSFRSADFVDPPFIQPDNSVPLVADKPTAIRLYTDYTGADSSLPAVARITGRVRARNTTTGAVHELRPFEAIAPIRDEAINRTQADHTLNFLLPASAARDTFEFACEVWDVDVPDRMSERVNRTFTFQEVEPLHLWLVAFGAPERTTVTRADFEALAVFARKVEPTSLFDVTGFSTIRMRALDGDPLDAAATPADDVCDEVYGELLDSLEDLRAASADLYVGMIPVDRAAAIEVGLAAWGCGSAMRQLAVSIADPVTLAHEIMHTQGLRHPDPDRDRPIRTTGGTPSLTTIGEVGFDPEANRTLDPAGVVTTMVERALPLAEVWIDPGRYRFLFEAFRFRFTPWEPVPDDGSIGSGRTMERLHLGFEVTRELNVRRRPSFHYPSAPGARRGPKSDWTVELSDVAGRTLYCHVIRGHAVDSPCWPKRFRELVRYPRGAAKLTIRRGDEVIHSEEIGDPPVMENLATREGDGKVRLNWDADGNELWFVVHFQDRDGVWRGIAPRSQDRSLEIPKWVFQGRRSVGLRVCATTGIATGCAETTATLQQTPGNDLSILVVKPRPDSSGLLRPERYVEVAVVDEAGRSIPDAWVTWTVRGAQQAIGTSLDALELPAGVHDVTVRAKETAPRRDDHCAHDREVEHTLRIRSAAKPRAMEAACPAAPQTKLFNRNRYRPALEAARPANTVRLDTDQQE